MPRKPNASGDHYNDPFPSRLRELIRERGIKQDDLTEVLKVKNRQSITGYIDGSTMPTIEKVVALASYFDVSTDYLLGRVDVKTTNTDLQAACNYMGLSESSIRWIQQTPLDRASLNDFICQRWFSFFLHLQHVQATSNDASKFIEDAKANIANNGIKIDSYDNYYPQFEKRYNELQLSLYEFERACRDIPNIFRASEILTELSNFIFDLEDKDWEENFEGKKEWEDFFSGKTDSI